MSEQSVAVWKNPVIVLVAGLLVGFMVGYVVGQGQALPGGRVAEPTNNPHAGIPGAPPITENSRMPAASVSPAPANMEAMAGIRALEEQLAKNPKDYDALVQMGNNYFELGTYAKAVSFYESARALRDDSPDVITDLGVCFRETGQPKKALELFEKAAKFRPDHWQSRYNIVVVKLFDLNDIAGAQATMSELKVLVGKADGMPDLTGLEKEIAKRLK
jgi:cytochrome c-type biogenesis protein CcmH/NrfG